MNNIIIRREFLKQTHRKPFWAAIIILLISVQLLQSCTKMHENSITVTTKTVTDITESSAKTGGSVISSGYSIGDCGVCYGESHNPTLNNSFTKDHKGDGSFSSTLSSLKSGTTYYVRAYAKTSSGIEYGNETNFTTQGGYTINVFANPTAGGKVTGAGSYQRGENCTVTATANSGYVFTNWTENGTIVSDNESYSFTVTESKNLEAHFEIPSYTISISVSPSSGGAVSGGGTYNQGRSCTLTATSNPGFSFTNWTENGDVVSTNASYTFIVTDDRNLVANFTMLTYTISVQANPINCGSVSGGGTYNYGQSCTIVATANSGYAFSNWKENGNVVSTNANYTFTVTSSRTLTANFEGAFNGHIYVDLGLPSGTLWATCNIGTTTPEGYGDYFAWGETAPKSQYAWSTYKYCKGAYNTLTKYCNNASLGYNGFTDNLAILQATDDAATVNWGNEWRTPTVDEWEELYNSTINYWTAQNGVNGLIFIASNGKTLFLPATGGYMFDTNELSNVGFDGYYWSNSICSDADCQYDATTFRCADYDAYGYIWGEYRCSGHPIRPVHKN